MSTPTPTQPDEEEPERNWFTAWVHRHPRQALMIGFVTTLLIFAVIRGIISDNPTLVDRTEIAKERWALIQTAQEGYYEENGRYTDEVEALDGVDEALEAPDDNLRLDISLKEEGAEAEMTLTGRTIRLTRKLANGEETDAGCLITVSRGGEC